MFCTRDDRSRRAASCDRTHQPSQARSTAVVHASALGSHFPLAHVRAPAPRSRLCGTPHGEFLSESANPSFESIMSRNLCCSAAVSAHTAFHLLRSPLRTADSTAVGRLTQACHVSDN